MKNKKTNIFKENYEKFILGVILIAFIFSLISLISSNNDEQDEEYNLDSLTTKHIAQKKVTPETNDEYERIKEISNNPVLLVTGTNAPSLLIAPSRVYCVNEQCKMPIPFADKTCKFCSENQPEDVAAADLDSDEDGMPDAYERKYGFNPFDPTDKDRDKDGDGFTNYEEYVAKSDPLIPDSHPPLIDFLVIKDVKSIQFPYELKGKFEVKDNIKFQINGPSGTRMVSVGEELGNTGYKLTKYDQKEVVIKRKGLPDKTGSVYVITLSKQQKEIQLQEKAGKVFSEREVFFVCTKDPEQKEYQAKEFETFSFDNVEYQVKSVDKNGNSVVILDKSNQQSRTVTR